MLGSFSCVCSCLFFFLIATAECTVYQFVQIPGGLRVMSTSFQARLASKNVNTCAQLIQTDTIAISWNGTHCTSFTKILGYNYLVTVVTWYLRMPAMCGQCASSLQAKQAILNYVYGNNACPNTIFNYDQGSGYCVGNVGAQTPACTSTTYCSNYASYTQGVYANQSLLVMSRNQATASLQQSCQYSNASLVMYNGKWYCYTQFKPTTVNGNMITKNQCSRLVSGGTVITFIHPAEPGLLSVRVGQNVYVGIYLYDTSAPVTAAKYRYFNNQVIPAAYRNFATNPPGGNTYVFINNQLQLQDATISGMKTLVCRSLATAA